MKRLCRQFGFLLVSLCLYSLTLGSFVHAQEVTQVPASEAARHIVKSVPVEYPNLAALARIQGKVILDLTIAANGTATQLRVVSGHPMLVQSALDAVRRWRYEPFLLNGVAVPVKTRVHILFALGPEAELQQKYYAQEIECRDLLRAKRLTDAGVSCNAALQSANKLKTDGFESKITAYANAGQAAYQLNNLPEAIQDFQERLKLTVAAKDRFPDMSGWADAHHDLAVALRASGQMEPAEKEYRETEKALTAEYKHLQKVEDSRDYIARQQEQIRGQMQQVFAEHVELLRQMGRNSDADDLEQRAKSLPAGK